MANRSRKRVTKAIGDDSLLFHAMYLMAVVDGATTEVEFQVLKGVLSTLPEFAQADVDELVANSAALVKSHGGNQASLVALGGLSDATLRVRAYLLAAEIAFASGDVDAAEDALLREMSALLQLEPRDTDAIVHTLAIKYASTPTPTPT